MKGRYVGGYVTPTFERQKCLESLLDELFQRGLDVPGKSALRRMARRAVVRVAYGLARASVGLLRNIVGHNFRYYAPLWVYVESPEDYSGIYPYGTFFPYGPRE